MKVLRSMFILTMALVMSSATAEAQILKKLKKRVQEATEEVLVEKAAEEAAEEAGNALDSLLDGPNEEQRQQQMDALFGQGGEQIETEDVYTFDTNVIYEMLFDADGESTKVSYSMWFSKKENYMGTQVSDISTNKKNGQDIPASMISILDDKNQATIILMEEQKIAQVISMERLKEVAEEEQSEAYFETLEKTGNKKKILGYDCEEYRSENEDLVYTFWITNDLEIYQKNMFYNLNRSLGGNSFKKIPQEAKGFMMEMSFENKAKTESGRMLVKDIQERKKSVTMSEYQFMNLSQFMR